MSEEQAKLMFIMRKAPHGSIYAYEGLEVILITGAYEQDISVLFIGDGIYGLKKGQDTSELGIKGFMKTYPALDGYDITQIYVDKKSMEERGLKPEDLIIDVEVLDEAAISKKMNEQHAIFPF